MPLMDGYEATTQIREIEKVNNYRPTLICALSAYTDECRILVDKSLDIKKRCFDCGMDDYLSKPLNMELMLQMISEEYKKKQENA